MKKTTGSLGAEAGPGHMSGGGPGSEDPGNAAYYKLWESTLA